MENKLPQYDLQIFATDIHERALKIARNGIYEAGQLKNIPGRLIKKYFEKIPEGYEIKRKVKQNVLFTKHDITSDPPFIRLDLIVCRNLMIYFNTELQRQILKLFNYALNPEGLLLMGKSENVNDPQYFENMDPLNKIFIKSDSEPIHGHLHSKPFHKKENVSISFLGRENKEISLKDIVKETLLNTFEHPFLIVDEQNKIREIYGSVRLFLELKDGGMNADITKMVNPELQLDLRALLVKVKKQQQMVKSRVIRFRVFDMDYKVNLVIKPLLYLYGKNSYYMVIFELSDDVPADEKKVHGLQNIENATQRIQELEEELAISRDQLQIFTEELEASNEELQAMNEELQSANEELKSGNEELETSNEELLSANEELSSTNNELRKINKNILEKDEELKNLYEKLEESEKRFKYLIDHVPVMIWMADPDMMGKYFNKRWMEFTGEEPDKLDPGKGFELLHPDDVEPFRKAYLNAAREKREFTFDYRLKKKDGVFIWVQCKGVPRYGSSGEFIGFIGANSNIHDIKTLEEKKDEFISIAGHELKTPMTTSLAYLQLLEEEIKGLHHENLEYYLEKITKSLHKMHSLIIDLLEVSRIDADRLNLNLEEIDFDEMVREYIEDLKRILPDRKIMVMGNTKSRIKGDKHRLEQVINNLLSNAAKFSSDDEPIEIQLKKKKQAVEMVIKDVGIGIPEEKIGKIFDRFYQVGEGKYKSGMGVGLYICREIIERHEGQIRVQSKKKEGTSFTVEIPTVK